MKSELLIYLMILALIAGCAVVRIESDPPGAVILYSPNGMPPWTPLGQEGDYILTPATHRHFNKKVHFYRVVKAGYLSTLPQLAESYPFHRSTLHFTLGKTRATIESEYREKGYVLLDGKWVDPQEKGLVEYQGKWITPEEKFTKEQREKGLVKFEGKWMTPEEKKKAFTRKQKEEGLILFKGRWITQADKQLEQEIDEHVDSAFSSEHRELPHPGVMGAIPGEKSRVRVLNGTGGDVMFFFSGKDSHRMALHYYESRNIDLEPGSYRVAVFPVAPDQNPACLSYEFKPGYRYSLVEEGTALEPSSGEALSPQKIKEKYDIPELEIPDYPTTDTEKKEENKSPEKKGSLKFGP